MAEGHGPASDHSHDHGAHAHPGPKTYINVAYILCIITVVEVAVVYIALLKGLLVPILAILSTVKFAYVAMYYMHLKFDPVIYTRLILSGLAIAGTVMGMLAALMAGNGYIP